MEHQTIQEPNNQKPKKKNSFLNILIKIVLPLALGFLILYFLFRNTDFEKMWDTLKDANYGILAFSLIFGAFANYIRAHRWKLLITPLGYNPKISNLTLSFFGNYAVNFALPRAGELWRCGMVSKEEKIPFTKLFGTLILDRILDTLTVAVLLLLAFSLNMQFFIDYLKGNQEAFDSIIGYLKSPLPYIGIFAIILIVFVVFKFFKNNFIVKKISEFLNSMWNDMKSIGKMKQKKRLILYSAFIYICYFFYFYTTFYAFDFTSSLGFKAGLIAFAMSSLAMIIPTNGGMGAWHAAVIASLMLYGVSLASSEAFAFGVYAIQTLWVLITGFVAIGIFSVKNRKAK